MQNLNRSTHNNPTNIGAAAARNLETLRKSVLWASAGSTPQPPTKEVLTERLDDLLVLEFLKDDGQKYLTLSVRGLYKHVVASITTSSSKNINDADVTSSTSAPAGAHDKDIVDEEMSSIPKPLYGMKHRKRATSVSLSNELIQVRSITHRERLGSYLHPRDMRRLVTPFSASNEPELMVRRHVMLLNFDPLRAIILRDRLLVIVPHGADSILVHLENRVRGTDAKLEASFFGDDATASVPTARMHSMGDDIDSNKVAERGPAALSYHEERTLSSSNLSEQDETFVSDEGGSTTASGDQQRIDNELVNELKDFNRHEWVDLPFELRCVDAVLRVVSSILSEDTYELQQATLQYIQRLVTDQDMADDPLKVLRALKDAASEMRSRVKGFMQSLHRVLDEDEDMALMNLSRLLTHPERFVQPVSPEVLEEESDEPELILEAHLQSALTLTNSLDLIQGQIDNADATMNYKLSTTRNRLLYANTVVSIVTLTVTFANLVGSYFGMNVPNHLEEEPDVFKAIVWTSSALAIVLAVLIIYFLRIMGAVPVATSGGGGDASSGQVGVVA